MPWLFLSDRSDIGLLMTFHELMQGNHAKLKIDAASLLSTLTYYAELPLPATKARLLQTTF